MSYRISDATLPNIQHLLTLSQAYQALSSQEENIAVYAAVRKSVKTFEAKAKARVKRREDRSAARLKASAKNAGLAARRKARR